MKDWLSGYKTYIVCVIAILTAVVAWSAGEITLGTFVEAVFAAIVAITMRAGIAKSGGGK